MDPESGRAVANYKIVKDNRSSYNIIAPGRQAPQSQRPVRQPAGGRQTYTDKDLEDIRAAEIELSKYRQGDYKIGRDNSSSYDLLRHDFQPTNSRAVNPSPFDRPSGDARPAKAPTGYGNAGAGGGGKAWTLEFAPAKAPTRPAKAPTASGNAKPARAPAATPFAKKSTGNNMAAKKPAGSRF